MTTTTEEMKKKAPRKGSKLAARIAELETQYAAANAAGEATTAVRLRTNITRLENGEPELVAGEEPSDDAVGTGEVPTPLAEVSAPVLPEGDASTDVTTTAAAPMLCPKCSEPHPAAESHHTNLMCPACQHVWKRDSAPTAAPTSFAADLEAAQAGAEPDANRIERETVEDVIDVKLTDADLADIARANAADDQEKTERQSRVDELKTELKEEKEAIEAIGARMHDRNNAVLKGSQARKAAWILESCFATNTARYIDPRTGVVVKTRALTVDERQVSLPLPTPKPAANDGQLSLGDAPADGTETTDPESLLAAAQAGEADPADAPLDNDGSAADLGDDDGELEDNDEADETDGDEEEESDS